jgi:hypothetical protein
MSARRYCRTLSGSLYRLAAVQLRKVGRLWAGADTVDGWQASPVRGALGHLAAIELFASTGDLLNPDAHVLQERAMAAGQVLRLWETPELFHDWILFDVPEAGGPRGQILGWLSASGNDLSGTRERK